MIDRSGGRLLQIIQKASEDAEESQAKQRERDRAIDVKTEAHLIAINYMLIPSFFVILLGTHKESGGIVGYRSNVQKNKNKKIKNARVSVVPSSLMSALRNQQQHCFAACRHRSKHRATRCSWLLCVCPLCQGAASHGSVFGGGARGMHQSLSCRRRRSSNDDTHAHDCLVHLPAARRSPHPLRRNLTTRSIPHRQP